jgi:hypothetical protein
MSNWVCADFSSHYRSVARCRGFAYWLVKNGESFEWIRNPEYPACLPALRLGDPRPVPELGLEPGVPMYSVCREHPELFAFLLRPQDYEEQMWKGIAVRESAVVPAVC